MTLLPIAARRFAFLPRTQLKAVFAASAATLALAAGSVGAVSVSAQSTPLDPQTTQPAPAGTQTGPVTGATTTTPDGTVSSTLTYTRGRKKKPQADADGKVQQTKDTRKAEKQTQKTVAAGAVDPGAKLPDKQLYDKAMAAIKKGRFDVARLDLQTMLNTYPDSQYQMRAKLAVADSWYKEGGTAALTQAESEYADFRVFFPNAPEAAEAQMRIGDIYFKQMDKPDRDYSKALHAEEEYRRMLTDYPDAPKKLLDDSKTRLREVQEVLASREANIASYYITRENWAAAIARYQTVADTYPLYSHMDDVLIGLGDSYEAEARYVRGLSLPTTGPQAKLAEDGKARLEAQYDGAAAEMYRKVVLEHAASPHVEDAKDRLAAMNLPIPTPSAQQLAASQALEDSRRNYQISDRLKLFILHQPDVVTTAGIGDPTLTDPKPTTAPTVVKGVKDSFDAAFKPASATAPAGAAASRAGAGVVAAEKADTTTTTATNPDANAAPAPLALKDVGTGEAGTPSGTTDLAPAATTGRSTAVGGNSIGIEVLSHAASTPGAAAAATGAPAPNNGLSAVGPKNATALPPVEKAAPAPDQPNQVTAATPAAQTVAPGKKAPKPEFDKDDESSSKHKKKKGLKKLDPLPQ